VLLTVLFFVPPAKSALAQKPANKPLLSEGENKAATAINSAPDAAAKLTAGEEFVKKYPKSVVRLEVAGYIAIHIGQVTDPAQKMALAEKFQTVFTEEKELDAIRPVLLDAYVANNRADDAFNVGAAALAKKPDDLRLLIRLTFAGTEAAKRRNGKYAAQSLTYGQKAIELMEANQKPADMDDAVWTSEKKMLPMLYQETGILLMVGGKPADAKAKFEKAVSLNPQDPVNYLFIGGIVDDQYQTMAKTYQQMPDSAQKQELMKKITATLDQIIDLYAHAVGLSMGRPEFQQLQSQVLEPLTAYYKFRHNQSIDGLQQLIDKYKAPANP